MNSMVVTRAEDIWVQGTGCSGRCESSLYGWVFFVFYFLKINLFIFIQLQLSAFAPHLFVAWDWCWSVTMSKVVNPKLWAVDQLQKNLLEGLVEPHPEPSGVEFLWVWPRDLYL